MSLRTTIFVFLVCVIGLEVQGKVISGYYASWKVYSTCKIEDIDPNLCSILVYAFAGINSNGTIIVRDRNADITKGGFKNFTALKKQNPKLKTLLGIGGWSDGSEKYSLLVESDDAKKTFINDALEYIRKYGFDGVDIDWEYPAIRGGRPQDKENFPKFLQEIRTEFDKHGFMLTVAVGASKGITEKAYNVPEISKAVHYIHLMTYDMHSYKDGRTGANAPLYSDDTLNLQYCTKAWISKGASPSKILLGVGAYGKTYTLTNSFNHAIGALASGPGERGPRSKSPGTLSYDEILEKEQAQWTKKWSDKQQIPYMYKDNQWIGYDDTESIKKKVNFANENNLGGIMMWSIDMDDARGLFGPPFPLLKTINKNL